MMDQRYTDDVVLMYHSKSKDVPPGDGVGEQYLDKEVDLKELSEIPNWRQKLSNFEESPFELDGLRWCSVEHFFQAQKFKIKAPDYYKSFAMDSNSELSKTPGAAVKKAGGKSGMPLNEEERARWEETKHEEMERALYAKFSQNEEHKTILLATKKAKLTHKPNRSKRTFVEHELMKVRDLLQ
ncbi:MAG: NADAR family protein [bacterium]|nr:NADAR family protein [bacterium]